MSVAVLVIPLLSTSVGWAHCDEGLQGLATLSAVTGLVVVWFAGKLIVQSASDVGKAPQFLAMTFVGLSALVLVGLLRYTLQDWNCRM